MIRPPFVIRGADVPETQHQYPNSDEKMAPSRAVGHAAGLQRIGVHLVRVAPGTRTSYPHAEEDEEEFVYVVDGELDALLLSGGECAKSDSRIFYPVNPERRNDMPWSRWWDDVPARPRGPHPGKPGR